MRYLIITFAVIAFTGFQFLIKSFVARGKAGDSRIQKRESLLWIAATSAIFLMLLLITEKVFTAYQLRRESPKTSNTISR